MAPTRIIGIILIVVGVVALAYGGFTYTKDTHKAELGPFKMTVEEREQVNIPQWLGVAALAGGIVLVLIGGKK